MTEPRGAAAPGGATRLALHTATARAIAYATGLPGSIMLARALGADGRGTYQLPVTAVSVLFFVSAAGVPQALLRAWGWDRLDSLRRSSHYLAAVLGGLGLTVGVLVFAVARSWLFQGVPGLGFALVLASLPLQLHFGFMSSLLTYGGRARDANTASALAVVIQSSAFIVGGAFGWLTVSRTCAIYLAGMALQWGWVTYHALRLANPMGTRRSVPPRHLLRTGLSLQPYVLANFLLLRVDVFFLARIGKLSDVGRYAIAVALAEIVWNVTDSILVPAMERTSNARELAEDAFALLAVRMTIVFGVLAAIVVSVTAPLIIPLLYGADFQGTAGVILALLPGVVAMGVWRVVALGTVRFGSPVVQPVISIVALAVNCMLNVVLIPHIGAVGAGLASSASYALAAALTIGWLTVRGDVAWLDLVPRRRDLAELRRIPAMVLRRS